MAAEENLSQAEEDKRHSLIKSRLEGSPASSIWNDGLGVPADEIRSTHRRVVSRLEESLLHPEAPDAERLEYLEAVEVEDTSTISPTTEFWTVEQIYEDEELNRGGEVSPLPPEPSSEAPAAPPSAGETPATPPAAPAESAPEPVKREKDIKVRFPIQVKLVAIITVLLVVSLGTITGLVSVLVSSDVQLTAEVNNFTINRRNSEAMNNRLRTIRSSVSSFLNDVAMLDISNPQAIDGLTAVFYKQNPELNALVLSGGPEAQARYLLPEQGALPASGVSNWIESEFELMNRARSGETLLRNVSPFFVMPQLVMLLPVAVMRNGTLVGTYSAAVFFSQQSLTDMLGTGSNISFLLSEEADVLVHTDETLVIGGANFGNISFIEHALNAAARGTQTIYIDETGTEYFGVYQRIVVGNTILVTIIKRAEVFQGIVDTTRRNIIISIIVLILSIVVIRGFAGSLSRPIRALTRAARKIENGDYDLGLTHESNDEIGVLTKSFIGMGNGLENFEKFTNKAIARLARKGKLARGGANRNVTVSFVLIRDFSDLSHEMNATQVVAFVNEYLERMVPCVTSSGGIVDKFLTQGGVIIMAVWGSPYTAGSPDRDALNCIRSMLMMRAALNDFNHDLQKKFWGYAPRIKIGCGINSGEVVSGQMGSERRMEYTIIGDAVNLAARLEGVNDVFDTDMLISEGTWKLIRSKVRLKEMQRIEVKGKAKPLRVFTVVNMKKLAAASAVLEHLAVIEQDRIAP